MNIFRVSLVWLPELSIKSVIVELVHGQALTEPHNTWLSQLAILVL